jgi:SAM-dependent methyltransferase
MTVERVRARVFGEVADEYDRVRPDYPPALVDDVLAYAGLNGSPALEVGAGTGKATLAFAERGVAVTAVEPDPAMARLIAAHPNIGVEVCPFEEYVPGKRFGLLFSAQAWHWTDPLVRWQRAADALAPGGTLALFWNGDRPADPRMLSALLAAHRTHAPEIDTTSEIQPEPSVEAELARYWPGTELRQLPGFGDHEQRLYVREWALSTEDYVSYLGTRSAYRMLTEQAREAVFGAILASIGPRVRLTVETALYLARRA